MQLPKRLPEVAVVRTAIVGVTAIVAYIVGHDVLDSETIERLCTIYAALSPVLAGWWVRRGVTPVVESSVQFLAPYGRHARRE